MTKNYTITDAENNYNITPGANGGVDIIINGGHHKVNVKGSGSPTVPPTVVTNSNAGEQTPTNNKPPLPSRAMRFGV